MNTNFCFSTAPEISTNFSIHEDRIEYLLPFTYHDCTSFGIHGKILAWYNPTAATFPISLLVDFFKDIFGRVVFQDDNPSGVRSHNQVI